MIRRLLREPLLQFLLLGAGLFIAYSLMARSGWTTKPGRIVITQGQLASMAEVFTRTRQRPPTREEWDGLVRARVREEVFYREALALGLDKDDAIIRRRLQQKMEFLSDDIAAQTQPTDAELNTYLQAHRDAFRTEPQVSFRQVFLNPEKRGAGLALDTARLLERLNQAGGDAGFANLGDPFPLERSFVGARAGEIAGQFGNDFAARLCEVPIGRWQGPVESTFGVHVVFVSGRTESRLPELGEVREAVRREWDNARRAETDEKVYQELLKRYTVTIEMPPSESAKRVEAAN